MTSASTRHHDTHDTTLSPCTPTRTVLTSPYYTTTTILAPHSNLTPKLNASRLRMGKKNDKRRGNKRNVDNFPVPKLVLVPHPQESPPPQSVIQQNYTLYTQLTTNPPGASANLHLEFPTAMRQHIRQQWTKVPNPSPLLFETVDMSSAVDMSPSSNPDVPSSADMQPLPVAMPMRHRYGPIRTVEEVLNSLTTAGNPWRTWMSVQAGIPMGDRRNSQRATSSRTATASCSKRSVPSGDSSGNEGISSSGSQNDDQSENVQFRESDKEIQLAVAEDIERYKKLIQEVRASNRKLAAANEIIGVSLLIDRQRPFNIGLREMSSTDFANFVYPMLASLNS